MNGYLRGAIVNPSKETLTHIKNLENVFKKVSLPQNTLAFRGVDFDFISTVFGEDIANKMQNSTDLKAIKKGLFGKTYTEAGFMSTSYDKKEAFDRPIMLKINIPKNTRALVIDEISLTNQKELLIDKNYKWKIKDVKI